MKKIIISIPVHEHPLVIKNHLENILKFVPNSSVILHASADKQNFHNEVKQICKQFDGFAYLNDTSYSTYAENEAANVTGLSTVHSSNFRFISKLIPDFDIFSLDTSNCMFVRRGIENLFENYECACSTQKADPNEVYKNVKSFRSYIDTMNSIVKLNTFEKCSQEGSYYPKNVFKEVSNIVLDKIGGFLAAEEIVLHTLAFNLFPELYNSNVGGTYVFHRQEDYFTKEQDILDVYNGKYSYKYVVKRVPRNLNDKCRIFVNELTKDL